MTVAAARLGVCLLAGTIIGFAVDQVFWIVFGAAIRRFICGGV